MNRVGVGTGRRNWKKRWFVLSPQMYNSQLLYSLSYYETPRGKLKGTVSLLGTKVEEKNLSKHVKYEFQIILQNDATFQLSCDDPNEKLEWIESLKQVLAYMSKPAELVQVKSLTDFCGYDPVYDDDEDMHAVSAN